MENKTRTSTQTKSHASEERNTTQHKLKESSWKMWRENETEIWTQTKWWNNERKLITEKQTRTNRIMNAEKKKWNMQLKMKQHTTTANGQTIHTRNTSKRKMQNGSWEQKEVNHNTTKIKETHTKKTKRTWSKKKKTEMRQKKTKIKTCTNYKQ